LLLDLFMFAERSNDHTHRPWVYFCEDPGCAHPYSICVELSPARTLTPTGEMTA
jgi:hypothetical protein